MRVMIVGASRNPAKFGNKAVRAYSRQGHDVLPVNPNADEIEGFRAYRSIADVPGPIDRATIYLHPREGMDAIRQIARRNDISEVWINPGAESPELIDLARSLGLSPIQACSIVAIGERP